MTKLSPGGKNISTPHPTEATIVSPIDDVSGAVEIIEFSHHEIHEGDHYTFSEYTIGLGVAATLEFIITTPDTTKWGHLDGFVYGALTTVVELFEDTTHTLGAAQPTFNNDRNSANTAGLTINLNAGTGADGTLIFKGVSGISTGSGTNARFGGGATRSDNERILKQNTKYLIRATSLAAANNVSMALGWYEHDGSA